MRSRCQRKVDGTIFWVILIGLTENSIISEWVQDGDPEFRAKKFRIRIIRVTTRAWISKTTIIGKPINGQIKAQRQRIHLCSEDRGWKTIFIKKAMQEVAEKLKNKKEAAGEIPKNNQDWKNILRSMIRNHEQWVHSSTILTYWAVCDGPTFLIKLLLRRVQESLAAKLGCCEIHERIWIFLEKFLIVNMLNEILRTEGIENNRSEQPLQSIPLPCFRVRARRKKSRRQVSLMYMTNHAVIGTCTQSITIRSYLSSEMHLQKILDQTEFQSWIVNFQAGVCAKAKNLALVW